MTKELYKFYVAMLKNEGKVERCKEVTKGLFAIEYTFKHPFAHADNFETSGAPLRLQGRFWLGDLSKLLKYLENLHNESNDKYKWSDGDNIYKRLKNISDEEDLNAARTDRDIPSNIKEKIQTKIKRIFKKRIHPQTVSPE